MKILFCLLLLPCAFGAYTICSDNTACPEGTKCCTTYEDKIRCCDVSKPESIYVKTTRSLQVVPGAPFLAYANASQTPARYGSCIEGITCKGTCCEDDCCDHSMATCCDGGCCGFMYHCCSGYTQYIVMKRWCCVKGMKCGDADATQCLDKGAFLTPHIAVIFMTAAIRMWFLKLFA